MKTSIKSNLDPNARKFLYWYQRFQSFLMLSMVSAKRIRNVAFQLLAQRHMKIYVSTFLFPIMQMYFMFPPERHTVREREWVNVNKKKSLCMWMPTTNILFTIRKNQSHKFQAVREKLQWDFDVKAWWICGGKKDNGKKLIHHCSRVF